MKATRSELARKHQPELTKRAWRWAIASLSRNAWLAFARATLSFFRISGLRKLARRAGIVARLGLADMDAQLPDAINATSLKSFYPARGHARGKVALFAGCVARLTDAQTLRDCIDVIAHLGYDVHVPRAQTCCGALHQHEGDLRAADRMKRRNVNAFASETYDAIVTCASGCGATLSEYGAPGFSDRIVDASTFLQRIEWPEDVKLKPLNTRVAIHDPCTLKNVQRAAQAPYELLRRIPSAQIQPLPGNGRCCGAAGRYHLEHREMARALRAKKIDAVREADIDIVATSNVGCAMYLAAGLVENNIAKQVVHPVSLIARQLVRE